MDVVINRVAMIIPFWALNSNFFLWFW